MADLDFLQRSSPAQIVGGDELYPADVDSSKKLAVLAHGKYLDDRLPIAVDDEGRLLVSGNTVISSLPSFRAFVRKVYAANATSFQSFPITEITAIKEFHVGGKVGCEAILSKYNNLANELITGFNSIGEVAAWTNTSNGSSLTPSWNYATDQFIEGTGSAKLIFTQSDANNFPEISFTFSVPEDYSKWRNISGRVRTTVATGGGQSRTVSIRIHSGTAIRIYQLAGTTNTPPFNTAQWHTINKEIEFPDSTAGTGVFDINNITRISLRLQDGGNKSGSIWWDDIKLTGEIDIVDKIYSSDGTTIQLAFDPVIVFQIGETLAVQVRNNTATAGEIQAAVSGVAP
jgi:hypothetical protein